VKRALLLVALAAGAGFATSAAAQWLPYYALPQLGLLAVVGFSCRQSGVSSLAASWIVGLGYDQSSVAPFGYHGLLFVLAWSATRIASHQIDLRNPMLYSAFVFGLCVALAGVGAAAAGAPPVSWASLGPLAAQGVVNAGLAHPMRRAVAAWLERFDPSEPARGTIRLSTRAALP